MYIIEVKTQCLKQFNKHSFNIYLTSFPPCANDPNMAVRTCKNENNPAVSGLSETLSLAMARSVWKHTHNMTHWVTYFTGYYKCITLQFKNKLSVSIVALRNEKVLIRNLNSRKYNKKCSNAEDKFWKHHFYLSY